MKFIYSICRSDPAFRREESRNLALSVRVPDFSTSLAHCFRKSELFLRLGVSFLLLHSDERPAVFLADVYMVQIFGTISRGSGFRLTAKPFQSVAVSAGGTMLDS